MKKILKGDELSKKLDLKDKVRGLSSVSDVELVSAEAGVLNKKVLDAKSKAQAIIEDARKEAERMRREAEDLLSEVKQKLEDERRRGYEEGREEGLSSVMEKLVAFERMKEAFYNGVEDEIIKLVMTISEKVIGVIVQENKETIRSIVGQALSAALGEKVLVRLNPEDYKVVMSSDYKYRDELDRTKRIAFKEDDTVSRGGCVVETEVGTIDARLETQLEAIRKALEL